QKMGQINSEEVYITPPNCTNIDTLMKRYYLPVMYSIIFIVGLVGNIISIMIYVFKMRPWKSSSIIMLNLAISDLLYVLSLPSFIYYYINQDSWTMGEFMCKLSRFVFHFNLYGSILFLTCLSIFRFIVVVHPLRVAQVQKRKWGILACVIVWVITAAELTPTLLMVNLIDVNHTMQCLDFASNHRETVWWYGLFLTILGYLIPLVIVCACYCRIVQALGKGPHVQSACRVKARKLIVVILLVFILCYLPFHILRILRVDTRRPGVDCVTMRRVHAAYIITRPITGLNTFFNLGLYTLAGDQFQQAFLSLFKSQQRFFMHAINVEVIE
uniref:Oxoglutarate (alpha-ketoglutarate) receptor 1a, tandem duplicate 3 n=1 Tax=Lepisosteus oculatus TaxID=7918 RepID=W5NMM9_LEPOC